METIIALSLGGLCVPKLNADLRFDLLQQSVTTVGKIKTVRRGTGSFPHFGVTQNQYCTRILLHYHKLEMHE